jgi:hypothetical protein
MRPTRVLFAAIASAAALSATPAVAATPSLSSASAGPLAGSVATTQGIIMRDGGVCDPIRHMGC